MIFSSIFHKGISKNNKPLNRVFLCSFGYCIPDSEVSNKKKRAIWCLYLTGKNSAKKLLMVEIVIFKCPICTTALKVRFHYQLCEWGGMLSICMWMSSRCLAHSRFYNQGFCASLLSLRKLLTLCGFSKQLALKRAHLTVLDLQRW